jgi:hypothetical protein
MSKKIKKLVIKNKKRCSICQKMYSGFGNNALPINTGRCCDKCNSLVVIARINRLYYPIL